MFDQDRFTAEFGEAQLQPRGGLVAYTLETIPPARIASMKAFFSTLSRRTGGYQYHS